MPISDTQLDLSSTQPILHTSSWKRLDGVDLLRGLAIFFVLMNHVNMRLRRGGWNEPA